MTNTHQIRPYLDKLRYLFDSDYRHKQEKIESLKSILSHLTEHGKILSLALAEEENSRKRAHLAAELRVVQVQCRKGKKLLQSLENSE